MKFYLFIAPLLLSGCLKTAADIERDKKVDQMSVQTVDAQKLLANLTLQTKDLQQKLATMTGQYEEMQHAIDQSKSERDKESKAIMDKLAAQLDSLSEKIETQQNDLLALSKEIQEHRAFIGQILKAGPGKSALKNEKSKTNAMDAALDEYKKKNYKKAKELFLSVLAEKNINPQKHSKALYHVGMIDYLDKNAKEAVVYFGKLYTKWPASTYAPGSLYHLGMSLKSLGEDEQASASFNELISKFPKSPFVKAAKKEVAQP